MINLLDILEHKNINIEAKKTISNKEKNLIPLYSKQIKDEQNPVKIELMERKKYEIKSIIKTFIPFDNENYLVLGLDTGEIQIYEEKEKEDTKEKCLKKLLEINEFNDEINNLCEIDKDKLVASDIKKILK